jgi:three-Cys-motif partner protein
VGRARRRRNKTLEAGQWSPVSAQRELNFTVVDGFAGGGRYKRDGVIVPGSPLLLIETVRQVERSLDSARSNGFKINADFFFVEDDPTTFDFLTQSIRESNHASDISRSIHLIRGDFNFGGRRNR